MLILILIVNMMNGCITLCFRSFVLNIICCVLPFLLGTNAVIKSLEWEDGDAILVADHTYPAVQNLVKVVANKNKGMS